MKKTILAAIAMLAILASCGGNKKQAEAEQDNLPIQSSEVLEQPIIDGHNAQNSLDYQGTYKGTLPTADGPGREVVVVLGDSTYTRTSVFLKGGEKQTEEGKYEWASDGSTITLLGAEVSNQYFVGEDQLFALDIDGKRIEGDLAEHYILKKE